MKLVATRRVAQAIDVLGCLAEVDVARPTSAEEVARATGVPAPTVRQLMQTLARAGLVSSAAGPHGGYWITCVPRETNMRTVVEAMEGPIDSQFCDLAGVACERIEHCAVHQMWRRAQDAVARELTTLTLDEVLAGHAA